MRVSKRVCGSLFGFLAMLISATPRVHPQSTVENPAKPLARDAGRVLKLAEVWRITDESGDFYFKYPRYLRVAEDGSIFLADAEQFPRTAGSSTASISARAGC